jgi:glycosyltransferase involved in cell wall biosynthesis
MRVCFTTEEHFFRTPDGCVWSPSSVPGYSFFRRYLGAFQEIRVIARVADVSVTALAWRRADGPGVSFAPVPNYVGPAQYLCNVRSIHTTVRDAIGPTDAILLRVGSQLATSVEPLLHDGRPFGLEVVGDPYNVFAPGANKHPLRAVWRWWFTKQMKRQCARAAAICYVTGQYLQQYYPPRTGAFCTSFQPMELDDETFVLQPRRFSKCPKPIRILTVGSLDQPYKGVDVLIDALVMAVACGHNVHLTVVGRGKYQPELKQRAVRSGLDKQIAFIDEVKNEQLLRDLDDYQLFVLASRTEGLPRVIIEAMARGVPCIASAVGGIPELLSPADLVPPGNAKALAETIVKVITDPERMERMSATNLERARNYSSPVMDSLRQEFLQYLYRATQTWLHERPAHRYESCGGLRAAVRLLMRPPL